MIKVPTSGYKYPLGPKIEKTPIPVGYMELDKAVDALGKDMFPTDWTGEERGYFKTGYFGQRFRSKLEYETDSAFRDAVLYAQCELECEMYGGDPQQRYERRKSPADDDEPFVPMGALPTLPADKMEEIENQFSEQIAEAKAARDRRGKVEDVFLRQLLWSGSVTASFVAIDGKIAAMEPHSWGSEEGKHTFERGWVELDKGGGWTTTRPVLIEDSALETHLSSSLKAKPLRSNDVLKDETIAPPRFSEAAVRTWYQGYIEGFAQEAKKPSRDEDLKAAREHFRILIPRDVMRGLRRDLAPEGWTARGAPKRQNRDRDA